MGYYSFLLSNEPKNIWLKLFRYSFNGQERDDEVTGAGNSYTAECWQYDARLGKRWNSDPFRYASMSNYVCFNNNPIMFVDPDGRYSKLGAWLRNIVQGGSGIYKSGNDWGYNTQTKDENGKVDGWAANFGKHDYKNATNFGEVLFRSLITHDEFVNLSGNLLNKIKQDPGIIDYQNQLIQDAKKRYQAEQKAFSVTPDKKGIRFGPPTDQPLNPFYQATLEVIRNELTWVVRHADVYANVEVQKDGAMTITYLLQDRLDLYPNGSSETYDVGAVIGTAIYHVRLGGTATAIKAEWSVDID